MGFWGFGVLVFWGTDLVVVLTVASRLLGLLCAAVAVVPLNVEPRLAKAWDVISKLNIGLALVDNILNGKNSLLVEVLEVSGVLTLCSLSGVSSGVISILKSLRALS